MKLAFYRASKGNWLDRAISIFSGFGPFSHVELVFSDGMSFSSTSRDESLGHTAQKPHGTRFKDIHFDAGKWAFAELSVSPTLEADCRAWCERHLDAKYDFSGVFHFIPVLGWAFKPDERDWFCSEVCVAALQYIGQLPTWLKPWDISPNRLAKMYGVR